MNIPELRLRVKNMAEDAVSEWGLIAIVLLLGLSSFGLGRLSALQDARPPVAIMQAAMQPAPRTMTEGGLVVAARGGGSYYYPWCTGATKIAPANQVWFQSEADAKAAGLAPAKGCKGFQGSQ